MFVLLDQKGIINWYPSYLRLLALKISDWQPGLNFSRKINDLAGMGRAETRVLHVLAFSQESSELVAKTRKNTGVLF